MPTIYTYKIQGSKRQFIHKDHLITFFWCKQYLNYGIYTTLIRFSTALANKISSFLGTSVYRPRPFWTGFKRCLIFQTAERVMHNASATSMSVKPSVCCI